MRQQEFVNGEIAAGEIFGTPKNWEQCMRSRPLHEGTIFLSEQPGLRSALLVQGGGGLAPGMVSLGLRNSRQEWCLDD